jgi:hypothetical protein
MNRDNIVNIRLTNDEKQTLKNSAVEHGFTNISSFLRFLALNVNKINIRTNK